MDAFLGKVSKGINCSAKGCSESAVKSLSKNKLVGSGIEVVSERRVYLCKNHYKELKKSSKQEDDVERIRWKG